VVALRRRPRPARADGCGPVAKSHRQASRQETCLAGGRPRPRRGRARPDQPRRRTQLPGPCGTPH
jgi:hypothetical protein